MKIQRLGTLSIAALVALLAAFLVAPVAVSAQTEDDDTGSGNVFDLEVTGTTDDGGTFEGTFSIDEFDSGRDGALVAIGTLTGELTISGETGDMVEQIDEEMVSIPVSADSVGSELLCGETLSLTLGPADVNLGVIDDDGEVPQLQQVDTVLHLDAVTFDVSTDFGLGGAFNAVLCNLSGLFGDELDADTLAQLLNLLIQFS